MKYKEFESVVIKIALAERAFSGIRFLLKKLSRR